MHDQSQPVSEHDPVLALEKFFGYRRFLEGQSRVVGAILQGRDTLAIMPTGGGKSLCYQLPALIMDGVTLVVSPLIALMKDQVDSLVRKGIPATMINSTLSASEQHTRINALRKGVYKLVYVAPERFRQDAFLHALQGIDIALLAVDEAHCISQWGHDFRPDYMRLHEAIAQLGHPQVCAFTATATPIVRNDILRQLKLRDPFLCISGFARPNLSLNITHCAKVKDKYDRLRQIIRANKTGIIYCSTRGKVEEVTTAIQEWRIKAIGYHAGLSDQERTQAQNKFISKRADVVVATNAFGMGIDRPDVRFVTHFDLPGSIEAYYQEAGRAGRDGEPAHCELLFNFADKRTQEFFIEGNNPSLELIHKLYRWLATNANPSHEVRASIESICEKMGEKNSMAISSALSVLVRHRCIDRFDIPGQRVRGTRLQQPVLSPTELKIDGAALKEKAKRDGEKLKMMIDFCYSTDCRQGHMLRYFGESDPGECGNCDQCFAQGKKHDLREATADEVLLARKALSGVARTCHKRNGSMEGKYGRARIIAMLQGSSSLDVINAGLHELTTYGILKDQTVSYLQTLFREMESAGLVTSSSGEHPVVSLTELGMEVMKQGGPCRWRWPSTTPALQPIPADPKAVAEPPVLEATELGFDDALFTKMKELRTKIGQQAGVQPHRVFNNQTLEFLTRLKPRSKEAALRIRGIDETRASLYLAPFLDLIAASGKKPG